MRRTTRTRIAFAVVCVGLATVVLAAVGCTSAPSTKLEPKVVPPAIKQAGTLKVGVDLSYPPFGGTDAGKQAGIDLDVASALAAKLGLTTTFVDVKPSDAATALAGGKVDVVFSIPYSQESLSRSTLAGSYLSDGPAFFIATESTAAVVPSMTLDTIPAVKIGAQEGSAAFWKLQSELGAESLVGYPTLRDALNALREGRVRIAAGDALVGGYIIRDPARCGCRAGQRGVGRQGTCSARRALRRRSTRCNSDQVGRLSAQAQASGEPGAQLVCRGQRQPLERDAVLYRIAFPTFAHGLSSCIQWTVY
jgi:cystine transport system substrate-binding protein